MAKSEEDASVASSQAALAYVPSVSERTPTRKRSSLGVGSHETWAPSAKAQPRAPLASAKSNEAWQLAKCVLEEHGAITMKDMRESAACNQIDAAKLQLSWDKVARQGRTRDKVIGWISDAFEINGYWDTWLAVATTLLDRVWVEILPHASTTSSHSITHWALAAIFVALKFGEADSVLGEENFKTIMMRDMYRSFGWLLNRKEQLTFWQDILSTENKFLWLLKYRVGAPTALDIAERFAFGLEMGVGDAAQAWPGMRLVQYGAPLIRPPAKRSFSMMAAFLIELATTHCVEVAYGNGDNPSILAFAACWLALYGFGEPPMGMVRLWTIEAAQLPVDDASRLRKAVIPGLFQTWIEYPQGSPVVRKWKARGLESLVRPPHADTLDSFLQGSDRRPDFLQNRSDGVDASLRSVESEDDRMACDDLDEFETGDPDLVFTGSATPYTESPERGNIGDLPACEDHPMSYLNSLIEAGVAVSGGYSSPSQSSAGSADLPTTVGADSTHSASGSDLSFSGSADLPTTVGADSTHSASGSDLSFSGPGFQLEASTWDDVNEMNETLRGVDSPIQTSGTRREDPNDVAAALSHDARPKSPDSRMGDVTGNSETNGVQAALRIRVVHAARLQSPKQSQPLGKMMKATARKRRMRADTISRSGDALGPAVQVADVACKRAAHSLLERQPILGSNAHDSATEDAALKPNNLVPKITPLKSNACVQDDLSSQLVAVAAPVVASLPAPIDVPDHGWVLMEGFVNEEWLFKGNWRRDTWQSSSKSDFEWRPLQSPGVCTTAMEHARACTYAGWFENKMKDDFTTRHEEKSLTLKFTKNSDSGFNVMGEGSNDFSRNFTIVGKIEPDSGDGVWYFRLAKKNLDSQAGVSVRAAMESPAAVGSTSCVSRKTANLQAKTPMRPLKQKCPPRHVRTRRIKIARSDPNLPGTVATVKPCPGAVTWQQLVAADAADAPEVAYVPQPRFLKRRRSSSEQRQGDTTHQPVALTTAVAAAPVLTPHPIKRQKSADTAIMQHQLVSAPASAVGGSVACEAHQLVAVDAQNVARPRRIKANKTWDDMWEELQALGWQMDIGPRGKATQSYYLPPGVTRNSGYTNRVHYFDSRSVILANVKQTCLHQWHQSIMAAVDTRNKSRHGQLVVMG